MLLRAGSGGAGFVFFHHGKLLLMGFENGFQGGLPLALAKIHRNRNTRNARLQPFACLNRNGFAAIFEKASRR
jgi:hypothetical protein